MKRLIVFAVLAALLLCGCGKTDVPAQTTMQTQPTMERVTTPQESTPSVPESTPPTQAPTEPVTEPATEPTPEMVTVYLLTNVTVFDSGSTQYHYDENYNIESYEVLTIENTVMYETFFEMKNENGMASVIRAQWPDGGGNEIRYLTYSEDGKLLEEMTAGSNYTGYQYAYDAKGNRTEKREYYEGMLQSIVYYEYAGTTLDAVWCEDSVGTVIFECRIENGRVLEKNYYDSSVRYGYLYEYDENGNPYSSTFYYDGENLPGDRFFFQAVEVTAERAEYLLEQQAYLLSII